jgi:hypothetical protein
VAINWNAALAWTAAFLDDVGKASGKPRPTTARQ